MLFVQCMKNHFQVVALVQARDVDNLDKSLKMFKKRGQFERHLEGPAVLDEREP